METQTLDGQSTEDALNAELRQLRQRVHELEINQNQHLALLDNMNEGLLRVDLDGVIEYVNQSFSQLLGYLPQELVGREMVDLLFDQANRAFIQQKLKNCGQGLSEQYEITIRTKSGQQLWISVSGVPLKDGSGNIIATLGIIADISEYELVKSKVSQRAQKLAALYETSLEINNIPDSVTLLKTIVTRASKLLGTFGGELFLLRPDGKTLQMVANYNLKGQNRNLPLKLGEGMAGKVALTGEPLAVENYNTWSEQTDNAPRVGSTGRIAGVPLKHGGRVVGVLNVFDKKPGYFSHDQIQLLRLFADQAVLAIENKSRYDQSQQQARHVPILNQLAREMTSLLEIPALCETVVKRVYDAFNFSRVSILTIDANINELVLQAIAGRHVAELKPGKYVQSVSAGLIGRAIITGETIAAPDVARLPDFFDLPGAVTGAQLIIPLKVGYDVLGILVISNETPGFFDSSEVVVLATIADQMALSLEKARLFEETHRRAEHLEILRKVSQDLIVLRNQTLLLLHISQYAIKLLKGDSCGLDLYNPQEDAVERVVSLGDARTVVGAKHYPQDGLVGRVMQTGELTIVADYQNWEGKMAVYADVSGCMIGIPIQWGEVLLGVLNIRRIDIRNQFTQEDVTLATQFADMAAIAVHNARLFSQAQQEISDRREAQEALKMYANELERSNKALDRFAIDAAHDLAAPLRSVEKFSAQLANNYSASFDERGLDYLDRIQNAVGRMQALTRNLLAYAEVSAQNKLYDKVHLNWVLEDVIDDLHVQINESKAQITVAKLPVIEADETQMRQLFQNLISNALKFQPPKSVPQILIAQNDSSLPQMYQILVQDNGIGFDEDQAKQIFTLFGRLHGKRTYEGSGIGLATCQRIVEQHNGTIKVKSKPGKGTTFVINFPCLAN